MLELKDITFGFDNKEKKPLVKNLNFSVKKGETIFITGKSGLGKSTLLNLISGFCDKKLIWTGEIFLNNRDISHVNIQKKRIGYMLQDYFLFPHFDVKNNLIFALPRETKNKKAYVLNLLDKIHMSKFSNSFPSELSGGQKARIACLRSVISKPNALLLDEPFSSLDKITKKQFQNFLFSFLKKINIPCIIVTHELIKTHTGCKELNISNFT